MQTFVNVASFKLSRKTDLVEAKVLVRKYREILRKTTWMFGLGIITLAAEDMQLIDADGQIYFNNPVDSMIVYIFYYKVC